MPPSNCASGVTRNSIQSAPGTPAIDTKAPLWCVTSGEGSIGRPWDTQRDAASVSSGSASTLPPMRSRLGCETTVPLASVTTVSSPFSAPRAEKVRSSSRLRWANRIDPPSTALTSRRASKTGTVNMMTWLRDTRPTMGDDTTGTPWLTVRMK